MEMGADLSAELRNVPPRLSGDLDITVRRGKSVVVTTEDITTIDPDDTPDNLTTRFKSGQRPRRAVER